MVRISAYDSWCLILIVCATLFKKSIKRFLEKLVNLIQCRLSPEEIDKVDNANDELTRLLTKYESEMHLRQLFFTLKEQLMIKEEKIPITLVAENNVFKDVLVSYHCSFQKMTAVSI